MNEERYKVWWQLHRRVAVGEQLADYEQYVYESGLAELEAEEMAALRPADNEWQALRAQWGELAARRQKLTRQEAALRARARDGIRTPISGFDHHLIGLEI
ncbi:MAG: hypothetical protein J2P21_18820 [Chloracidobacterium sp.]|nr:hypothetical protein [Chloracidobacterium sp.]